MCTVYIQRLIRVFGGTVRNYRGVSCGPQRIYMLNMVRFEDLARVAQTKFEIKGRQRRLPVAFTVTPFGYGYYADGTLGEVFA